MCCPVAQPPLVCDSFSVVCVFYLAVTVLRSWDLENLYSFCLQMSY